VAEYRELLHDLIEPSRGLRDAAPQVSEAFAGLHNAALADGEVPARIKEVIALAMGVIKQCELCIAYHARGAARLGATPGEVAEILAVATLMDGGPATMSGARAWAAFNEFRDQGSGRGSGSGPAGSTRGGTGER
jgi:AhpD family alkylhydroperoxidase